MMGKVIHIRHAQGKDDEVYIGRWRNGYFGNPVRVGHRCSECGITHSLPGTTLPCYRIHMTRRLKEDAEFARRVSALKGKTLICHCAPGPCHGDVLLEAAGEGLR